MVADESPDGVARRGVRGGGRMRLKTLAEST